MNNPLRVVIPVALAGLVAAGVAFTMSRADDPVSQGRELAVSYCGDCHATGQTDASAFAEAPAFRTLGERYDVRLLEEALVEGLVSAHEAMPEFEFDPDQAQALIAYLVSLQPAPAAP